MLGRYVMDSYIWTQQGWSISTALRLGLELSGPTSWALNVCLSALESISWLINVLCLFFFFRSRRFMWAQLCGLRPKIDKEVPLDKNAEDKIPSLAQNRQRGPSRQKCPQIDKGVSLDKNAEDKIPSLATHPWTQTHRPIHIHPYIYIYIIVGDRNRGRPEGPLFSRYYTEV